MDTTNWRVPPTASGEKDVRVGDAWAVNIWSGGCGTVIDANHAFVWMQGPNCRQGMDIDDLTRLISRDGVAWDVPEDKRKGRWVPDKSVDCDPGMPPVYCPGQACVDDAPMGSMVWLPAAPAVPTEPEAGKVFRRDGLVYLPIHGWANGSPCCGWDGSKRLPPAGYWYPGLKGSGAAKLPGLLCAFPMLYRHFEISAAWASVYGGDYPDPVHPSHAVFVEVAK